GRNLLTHPLLKERLLRQAESRKTVSRSFGYENRRICFRTTRC
ncbi:CMD domain-containing protein, partial [Salmonella enterica subsp. enterica serovar Newport]|nr:CMD domain-containing protein [Salmonella enterica subsp. enterica serovar Newport]